MDESIFMISGDEAGRGDRGVSGAGGGSEGGRGVVNMK